MAAVGTTAEPGGGAIQHSCDNCHREGGTGGGGIPIGSFAYQELPPRKSAGRHNWPLPGQTRLSTFGRIVQNEGDLHKWRPGRPARPYNEMWRPLKRNDWPPMRRFRTVEWPLFGSSQPKRFVSVRLTRAGDRCR